MSAPNTNPPPAKPSIRQLLVFGVIFGVAMALGRIAGDTVRESLGWWGSMAIGTLAAMVGALVALFVINIW